MGLSVLKCKDFLQEPFVFCSCDTLVLETIPEPYQNWMGFGERDRLKEYRTISINKQRNVAGIHEKGTFQNDTVKPYIGLSGIRDYEAFWNSMVQGGTDAIIMGESYGLHALVAKGNVKACGFTWYDTGVEKELAATRQYYHEEDAPNILPKMDEAIWFMERKVIKFSDKVNFISDRVKRAEVLKGYVPRITGKSLHMYAYDYVPGEVLSSHVNLPNFQKLLDFSKGFWVKKDLDEAAKKRFKRDCEQFYSEKTWTRIGQFYERFGKADEAQIINGIKVPALSSLLGQLNWNWVTNGLPGQFHGDYHFENILIDEERQSFCFLDWRQNFGSSLEVGDIYYDLSKLLHGLIICHELIAAEDYKIEWNDNGTISYDFHRKESLVECEEYYYVWLQQEGYDVEKVKVMTALIFLNIAALHHFPYGLLLYALGKKMLFESIISQQTDDGCSE